MSIFMECSLKLFLHLWLFSALLSIIYNKVKGKGAIDYSTITTDTISIKKRC